MKQQYNEWDFLPVSLTFEETNDPLSVIDNFFQDDNLDGHLKRLTRWRDFVLSQESYSAENESSHSIYYFHKLTVKLIDAAALILKTWPESSVEVTTSFPGLAEILASLSEARKLEVYAALSAFFADDSLPAYRQHLDEWLDHALSNSSAGEFIDAKKLIKVYENLQALCSAMWMLNYHCEDFTPLNGDNEPEIIIKPAVPVRLYQLNTSIEKECKTAITQITEKIKFKLLSAQAVIYLGTAADKIGRRYFLILTDNSEARNAQSLATMIEESCREIAPVFVIVNHAAKLFNGLEDDDLFYQHALTRPVVYLQGTVFLPQAKPINICFSNERALFRWNRWYNQAKDFLSGADFYINSNCYGAALFSLHQCAECALTAIIRGVLHYQTNSHNLARLLILTEMFTNDLSALFHKDDMEAKARFDMLNHAYVNVRYRDTFVPDPKSISFLYHDIAELVNITEKLYARYLSGKTL